MSPLFWIILFIIFGIILFFAELVLLPGITIAAVGSFCCLVAAAAWSFAEFGVVAGFITLGIILVLVLVMVVLFLRPKTWKKVTLSTQIKESIDSPIEHLCQIGQQGEALTRLAPMGKVIICGHTFEAKTMGDYIDQMSGIEVIGFDNQNVIVKLK